LTQKLLVLALALGFALPAFGAGPPPSIDDLDGATFTVRSSGPEYDLNGDSRKGGATIVWTITKTGANTVSFDSVFGGMIFTAYYVDGFLMQSFASGESPPEDGSSMVLAVTGQPGKLRLKGQLTVFAAPPGGFQVLRVLKVTGSQLLVI